MRNLIKGDFRRIMGKRNIWIMLAIAYAFVIISAYYRMKKNWNGFAFMYDGVANTGIAEILFSIVLFLAVYGDEFRAMAMITAIGRGISRRKLVLAKFLGLVAATLLLYLLYWAGICLLGLVLRADMDFAQGRTLFLSVAMAAYKTIGYVSVAAVLLYLTNNIPLSTFLLIALIMIVPFALYMAESLPVVGKYHLGRYYYAGLSDSAFADFHFGLAGSAVLSLLAGFLFYVVLPVFLSAWILSRKELDF